MSRKHASFSQLIDYIERGTQGQHFTVYQNLYTRHSDQIKAEFEENARLLRFRKNGVYLYHEVISITRSQHAPAHHQKEALQKIVESYLQARAGKQLAYGVLHEDKADNLHFHLVISANEVGNSQRKRLSKADFSEIQTRIEQWVLSTFPELEQKAVFSANQTEAQRVEKQQQAHISNSGAELKRRGGKTTERDTMKATLETIFSTATSGQHFSELLQNAGLKFYTRGKNHGVSTEDGTKYRFSTLGLTEAWETLDQKMTESLKPTCTQKNTQDDRAEIHQQDQPQAETHEPESEQKYTKTQKNTQDDSTKTHQNTPLDPVEAEIQRRLAEAEERRQKKAERKQQTSTRHQNKPS